MKKFKTCAVLFMLGCMQILYATIPSRPISFADSMRSDATFDESLLNNNAAWNRLERLYNGYRKQGFLQQNLYTIPRRIHFIWLGEHPMSNQRKELIETWSKLHPQWKIKIWTKKNVAAFKLYNLRAFYNARSIEQKTAIWSYEILHRYGGIYADTNFECLRPFNTLHQSCEFYAGIGSTKDPLVFNNLMGCVAHHPIMKRCMDMIHLRTLEKETLLCGIPVYDLSTESFGSSLLTRGFERYAIRTYGTIVPLPISYFYPQPFSNNKVSPLKFSPETYAIPHKLSN